MTKPFIPFRLIPGSWGLKGKTYDRAEAEYNLEGEELDRRLCDIDFDDDPIAHKRRSLQLDIRHRLIDDITYQRAVTELDYPEGLDRDLAMLSIDLAADLITLQQFEKKQATLLGEPWVGVIDDNFDPDLGLNGFHMEFDWNEKWIETLREHGYRGDSDEHIIEQWFQDVTTDLQAREDEEAGYSFVQNSPAPRGRRANRVVRDGGTADYY